MTLRPFISTLTIVSLGAGLTAACTDPSVETSAQSGAPQATTTAAAQPGVWTTGGVNTLAADYLSQCAGKKPRSSECEILRSLLVVETAAALERLDASRDKRGVEQALRALEFPEEPELFVSAARILGRAPTTAGLLEKVLPQLLNNRYLEVQRSAASLLAAMSGSAVEIGRLWLENHQSIVIDTPYQEYPDFPAHYGEIGFPKYAGAEWFSPADTDRSVGWWTKDDAATVTRWFAQTLRAEPMDVNQWTQTTNAEIRARITANEALLTRFQELMGKAFKGDKAAAEQAEALQKDMDKVRKEFDDAATKGLAQVLPLPSAMADARWIVAKKKDGRISTVVVVYAIPGMQRTVIQLAWNLTDYPKAWGAD